MVRQKYFCSVADSPRSRASRAPAQEVSSLISKAALCPALFEGLGLVIGAEVMAVLGLQKTEARDNFGRTLMKNAFSGQEFHR